MYNVEDCTRLSWSDWNWSNIRQSCGNGIRNRSADTAKLGGRTCEELFGINFTTEMKIEPCPGIINDELCEINCHMHLFILDPIGRFFSEILYLQASLRSKLHIILCTRQAGMSSSSLSEQTAQVEMLMSLGPLEPIQPKIGRTMWVKVLN